MTGAMPTGPVGGHAVAVRYAVPGDLPALRTFVRGLSVATRASRFFAPVADLPEMLAEALTHRDPLHRFLVAEAGGHDDTAGTVPAGRRIVALAQAVRDREAARVCDIAVVVSDGWQRRGLGRTLLRRLLDDQRREDVDAAVGEVLRHNRAMIGLARQEGFELRRHPDDATVVRIVRDLRHRPPPPVPASAPAAAGNRVGSSALPGCRQQGLQDRAQLPRVDRLAQQLANAAAP